MPDLAPPRLTIPILNPPPYATLSGFDLVYAITESTINAQLALLSAQSILPTTWTATSSDGLTSIDATLGTPVVSFETGADAGSRLQMRIAISSGTFTYYDLEAQPTGPPKPVKKTADLSGAGLVFVSGLNLAEITSGDQAAVPPEVQAQLNKFDQSMLSVQQIFIDLEDANLTHASLDVSGLTLNTETLAQVQALIDQFIASLKGKPKPYVLGFNAVDRAPATADATWHPTGMNLGLHPDPTAGLGCVNFLMVTDGRAVPQPVSFANNWVTDANAQGAFVISQELMFGTLIDQIAHHVNIPSGAFGIHDTTTLQATYVNDIGGDTTITITPQVGTSTIDLHFKATFKKDVHDKLGSYIGYVDGYQESTSTLTFSVDSATGTVSATSQDGKPTKVKNEHPNFLGKFEQALSIAADTILGGPMGLIWRPFETLSDGDWIGTITNDTTVQAVSVVAQIVMPGGGELIFKDLVFNADGSTTLTTTVRD